MKAFGVNALQGGNNELIDVFRFLAWETPFEITLEVVILEQ